MKRISRDELYIEVASLMSKRSTCGRLNVGCVITKDGRIIATGYNGPIKNHLHCDETNCDQNKPCSISVHAEANAISFAARFGVELLGTVIYCTHAPCIKCAELIVQSGITEVVYKEGFREVGGLALLNQNKVYVRQYTK